MYVSVGPDTDGRADIFIVCWVTLLATVTSIIEQIVLML